MVLWKRPVEKPVETVEKCEFSTGLRWISNYEQAENRCADGRIRGLRKRLCEIMSPWKLLLKLEKEGEKVCKMPKVHKEYPGVKGEIGKIFV